MPNFSNHFLGLLLVESFQLCQVDGLLAHAHLLVQSALLGQVADVADVVCRQRMTVEGDAARVGQGDVVDDSDQGRLSGTVRTEQSEHLAFRHADAHTVEGGVVGIALHDIVCLKEDFFHIVLKDML